MTDLLEPPPPARRYYTVDDLASLLHCTTGALRVRMHRGHAPPSVKIGQRRLFPAAQVDEWLTQQETNGG